jgi:hypothetical protein
MIRSLAVLTVTAVAALAAPSAQAATPTLAASAIEVAMTNQYVWWNVRGVPGCKDCRAIYRTRISDGFVEQMLKVRHAKISGLKAGGDTLAFRQVTDRGPRIRSSVWTITEGGLKRRIAIASYRMPVSVRGLRNCGKQVGSLGVSPVGEVTWWSFNARERAVIGCWIPPEHVDWSAHVYQPATGSRTLQRKRRMVVGFRSARSVEWFPSLTGYAGRFGLLQTPEAPTRKYDFQTGEAKQLTHEWFDDDGYNAVLGPGGQVAMQLYVESKFTSVVLLPKPMDFATAVDVTPSPELNLQYMKWCGDRLILISAKRGYKLVIDSRDAEGALVASKEFQLPKDGELEEFVCNSKSATLRYYIDGARAIAGVGMFAPIIELP